MNPKGLFILGIDPGFKGGIAVYAPKQVTASYRDEIRELIPMPVKKLTNGKTILDLPPLVNHIRLYASLVRLAVLENVTAAPNQGVTSMFRFGYQLGAIEAILVAFEIPTIKVNPAVWKNALNLSQNKKESIAYASKLFPSYKLQFEKSDGLAEAAILATLAPTTSKP